MNKPSRGLMALAMLSGACGGDGTGPAYQEFLVSPVNTVTDACCLPTLYITQVVQVADTGGVAVNGALVRFQVSTGTAMPSQILSGTGGFTSVGWTLTAQQGHTETLSGCASNLANRCDTYYPLVTVTF